MKAFAPSSPIRLFDLLSAKAAGETLAIASELFYLKSSYSDAKCEKMYHVLSKAIEQLDAKAVCVSDLLTGKDSFEFWPKIMAASQIPLKEAAEDQHLAKVSDFNSCGHAIYVPVCKALGGEFVCDAPQFREFYNQAEEVAAFIVLGDSLSQVTKKIQKAFCPEKQTNGVLQQFELVEKLEGSAEVAGHKYSFAELSEAFLSGAVGPKDIKDALTAFYSKYCQNAAGFSEECQAVWKMK